MYEMGYTPDGFRGPDGLVRRYAIPSIVWVDAKTLGTGRYVSGDLIVLFNSEDPEKEAEKLSGICWATKIGKWDKATGEVHLIKCAHSWTYKLLDATYIRLAFQQKKVDRF